MSEPAATAETLRTSTGEFPLHEYRLRAAGREWSILHASAVLSYPEESRFLHELSDVLPYGAALWPSSVVLAHAVAGLGEALRGRRLLELGAGTGMPGLVAASLGARVVQTDREEVALHLCRRNGARNGAPAIEYRLADWVEWDDPGPYDLVVGADILYRTALHPDLRRILESSLAPGGRVLIADPFRPAGYDFLEALESDGWTVSLTEWRIGEEGQTRPMALYELAPP